MKKFLIVAMVVAILFGIPVIGFAEETGRGNYTSPILEEWLNENPCFYHTHDYTDKKRNALEAGVGVNLLLFQFGEEAKNLKKVKLELKKDFVDIERASAYLVAEIDVSSIFAFLKK